MSFLLVCFISHFVLLPVLIKGSYLTVFIRTEAVIVKFTTVLSPHN